MKDKESKEIIIDGENVTVTILKIKTKVIPELTLNMILKEDTYKEFGELNSIDEFKEVYKESSIEAERIEYYYAKVGAFLRDKIVEESKFEIDEKELEGYCKKFMDSLEMEAAQEGIELKEYMKTLFSNYEDLDEDSLMEKVRFNLRQDFHFMIYAIATLSEDDKKEVSESNYEKSCEAWAKESGEDLSVIKNYFSYDDFVSQGAISFAQERLLINYLENQNLIIK